MRNLNFVFLSLTSWDWHFQREQQLAVGFAKRGHRVLFIDSPISLSSFFKDVKNKRGEKKFLRIVDVYQIEKNLYLHSPVNVISARHKPDLQKILNKIHIININRIIRKLNLKKIIFFPSTPLAALFVDNIRKDLVCFDLIDEYRGYNPFNLDLNSSNLEKDLIRNSDIILCTAIKLYERTRNIHNNVHLIPNAVDIKKYENIFPVKTNNERPVIGFIGYLEPIIWDLELLEYTIRKLKNYEFVFVGLYNKDAEKFKKYSNVNMTGRISFHNLINNLKKFDVCLIPFNKNELIECINPVKMYEYLATGKPIVSTELPEPARYNDVIYIAKDKEEFVEKIEFALQEKDENLVKKRIQIAKENTWDKRVEEILNIIQRFLDKR
jgi:hypothetical protein